MRDGKQSMYEGGLKVPALVSWPGRIAAGSVSGQINLTMDVLPTLAELVGASLPESIDGRSFLPTLLGKEMPVTDRPLYFVRREGGTRYGGKAYHALRRGDWKLLQNSPYQAMELYHLKEDPLEQTNRIERDPEVYRELHRLLRLQIQESGKVPWQRPDE
ncbi:sulfatase [Cyclobacterium xiamenense]|uniref:sulfatase family protein n=1 Tax=Cyclobacterium xiamenense TaxID=1297121 RepID=UPI0035CFB501